MTEHSSQFAQSSKKRSPGGTTLPCVSSAIISDLSPRDSKRRARSSTEYIILHTTEGGTSGSLSRIKAIGAVHFTIDEAGNIYRTLNERKVGNHTGISLWKGDDRINSKSIGIEMVGCSRTRITQRQEFALRCLLTDLKKRYKVRDDKIIPHAMVAYQWNPFEKKYVRGRREDAIQFANPEMRKRLGLGPAPKSDPDVTNNELSVVNFALRRDLFNLPGAQQITTAPNSRIRACPAPVYTRQEMADARRRPGTTRPTPGEAPKPEPTPKLEPLITEEEAIGILTVGVDGNTAFSLAGNRYKARTTLYLFPNDKLHRGDRLTNDALSHLPKNTRVFIGYQDGGKILPTRSASSVAGQAWDEATTYYLTPNGLLLNGATVDESAIPVNTRILFRAWQPQR